MANEAQVVWFFEPSGSPNLSIWPDGSVPVSIYARVESPDAGHSYLVYPRLYRGQNQGSYRAYDTGTLDDPPVGLPQTLTTSWALYSFSVPVQSLTGPTSDRLFLAVIGQRDDGLSSIDGAIHIGSDGGANQTRVASLFNDPPQKPTALERNPDSSRTDETITTSVSITVPGSTANAPIGSFDSHVGDPGLSVWPTRVWSFRIWARATAGVGVIKADIARVTLLGAVTSLAANVAIGTVSSSEWTLFRARVPISESTGTILAFDDIVRAGLSVDTQDHATIVLGAGLDHPSSINAPLLAPASGTVSTPAVDDGKVQTESDSPRWYLRDAVQSSDGSIVPTVDPSSLRLDLKTAGSAHDRPGIGYAEISGAGIVTFPANRLKARTAAVASLTTLNGIDSTGFLDGDDLLLYLNSTPSNVYALVHNATTTPPARPFSLETLSGVGQKLTCKQPASLLLWFDEATLCFRLLSAKM